MKIGDILVKKSKIAGRGIFATKSYKKKEFVFQPIGRIVHARNVNWPSLGKKEYNYLQISAWKYLVPQDLRLKCTNHSCNPNLGVKILEDKISLVAIKPIKKGQELTFDYSTTMLEEWDEKKMKCNCGSKNCRKEIGDFRNVPKKIRIKYIRLGVVPQYILDNLERKPPIEK